MYPYYFAAYSMRSRTQNANFIKEEYRLQSQYMSTSINYIFENFPQGEQRWAEDTALYNEAAPATAYNSLDRG